MSIIQKAKNIMRWLIPYGLIMLLRQKKQPDHIEVLYAEKMLEIKNYFLNLNYNEQKHEIVEIIDFFKKHEFLTMFPYKFIRNYNAMSIDVFYDKSNKTRYVIHEDKRLYFPENWSIAQIQNYYNNLTIEQDEASPHRYETAEFTVNDGDVIADIGAAEGIWALQNIEKASKVYLFECESMWINALLKTFEPWKEKVIIVNKYISDKIDKKNVTLDNYFYGQTINFIKADIEGMELKMLNGGNEILKKNCELKILLCTYHQKDDFLKFKKLLEKMNFVTEYSKGYMIYIYDFNLDEPYIRHGLIRAKKLENL